MLENDIDLLACFIRTQEQEEKGSRSEESVHMDGEQELVEDDGEDTIRTTTTWLLVLLAGAAKPNTNIIDMHCRVWAASLGSFPQRQRYLCSATVAAPSLFAVCIHLLE